MEPIRILQYGLSGGLAGIENVIMDLYRNIDREKIQFDFLMMNNEDPYFKDEILSYGGRIYKSIYQRGKNPIKGCLWNYEFFRKHNEFSAIHCNVSSLLSIDRILTPYVCTHIPQRIIHIHNAGEGKETKKQLKNLENIRYKLPELATELIACSDFSGRYNFRNIPYQVVPNCIRTNDFKFDKSKRNEMRKKLHIENYVVIGVVGRLRYQKNHEYLLKVFQSVLQKRENYVLLIVGNGPLEEQLKQQALELGISDSIIWAGEQKNVVPFYCAMDQYVMPSRYEGFGLVYLEAQCCGLPCIGSENVVPYEVRVTDNMKYISLQQSTEYWAEEIIKQPIFNDNERETISKSIPQMCCDISDYAKRFEKIYDK